MSRSILVAILLVPTLSYAKSAATELSVGGITTHFIAPGKVGSRFENKINESGIILNPLYSIRHGDRWKGTLFFGDNSVGTPMGGVLVGRYAQFGFLELGVSTGFYLQSTKEFQARGIKTGGFVRTVMPVLGLELNPTIYRVDGFFIKVNNMITPALSNHSIGFGIDFEPTRR